METSKLRGGHGGPRSLPLLSRFHAGFREGKTNFDSTYQRNNPNRLVVRDNLHKVKSHKGGRWNGNPETSFLTGDRIDDSTRKCVLREKADEL